VKQEAIRKATLRWHPDIEFAQKFGEKIQTQDGQSEAVHAAVIAVFQSTNALRK